MGADTETVPEAETVADGPRRAGTAQSIGIMAAIALVAVTVVVVSARLGGNSEGSDDVEETVPTTLAGGMEPTPLPDALVASFDAPVIGARELDELPPDALAVCLESLGGIEVADADIKVEYAVATPDGLFGTLLGKGELGPEMGFDGGGGEAPTGFRGTCAAREDDNGGWISDGGGMEILFGDEGPGEMNGTSYSCCDSNGLATASGTVEVPDDADWAVQDRNGWYLAYPTTDRNQLLLTWKFRENRFGNGSPPQSPVTFVDADGVIIGEGFAGGNF